MGTVEFSQIVSESYRPDLVGAGLVHMLLAELSAADPSAGTF
jgi:hypothetical protein